MSALPKMATATPYPPQRNSPYMKVDNDNDDDGDDDNGDDDDDGHDDDIENGENGNDDPVYTSAKLTVQYMKVDNDNDDDDGYDYGKFRLSLKLDFDCNHDSVSAASMKSGLPERDLERI